jgi:hypothetical protein
MEKNDIHVLLVGLVFLVCGIIIGVIITKVWV